MSDGVNIPNALTMFEELAKRPDSSVKLFFTPAREVDELNDELPLSIPKAIPGTMKIHQLIVDANSLRHRQLSCLCKYPAVCNYYDLSTHIVYSTEQFTATENGATETDRDANEDSDCVELSLELVGKWCVVEYCGCRQVFVFYPRYLGWTFNFAFAWTEPDGRTAAPFPTIWSFTMNMYRICQ